MNKPMLETIISNIRGTIRTYENMGDVQAARYWTSVLAVREARLANNFDEKNGDMEIRPAMLSRKQKKRLKKEEERKARFERD